MKLKTFILTFLMMSCSIVFGQGTYSESAKTEAQIMMHLANDEVGTITIANNISIGNTIEIPNGRKVTIDLNGHELSTNQEIYIFKNFGKLTITDSDPEGKGTIIAPLGIYNGKPQTRTISTDINYNAQLTINGGKFVSTSSNVSAAIYNHLGVINIRGGEFYGEYSAITNYGMANIENAYIECLNRDSGAAAIINDFEIEYGENVRIVGRYTTATETGVITPSDYKPTYLFAELDGTKYPSLQAALDACTTGDNTINLLFHNSDNATVSQKEGVNIIIDGNGYKDKQFEYTGTIYVNGNSRHTGAETLTIQDVDFYTEKDTHDFISCNDGGDPVIRYAHNVTVQNCNFNAKEESTAVVALRFRQSYNINVIGSTFTNLHSAMWATGTSGIAFDNITATKCKEGGISVATSTPVSVKNSTIEGSKYGVRADGSGDYSLTVEKSTLTAEVPVIVRNTTGDYNLTVKEDATLASTNNGPQVVVTEGSDNADYVVPTSDVNVTLYDNVTSTFGLTAKIGNAFYATLQDAVDNAKDGDEIVLVSDVTEDVTITQKADLDLIINGDGKKFTGVMTVFGDARHDGNETLTIKDINFVAKNGSDACILSPDRNAQNPARYSYSHNVTVDNCTFTDPDGNVNCAAIRHGDGGDVNWTLNKCTVDNTMHSLIQTNNVNGKLVIAECTVNSKNGVNLNSCTNVEMTGCNFDVQGYALRSGVNSGGNLGKEKRFVLNNNTLKSACDDGDAVIMFRASSVDANFSMKENVVSGTTHISGNTAATKIAADANYWDGKEAPVVAEGSTPIIVNSYYKDEALTNLVRIPMGSDFTAYTREDAIWGEVGGNAIESFVIKVLDANNNVMGTTSLNNVNNIIDGSVYVTWSLKLDAESNQDEYWTMQWTTAPSIDNMPAKVELYVDGTRVGGGDVVLNAPDNLSKINAANIDADGKILSYRTTLEEAVNNGDNVAILTAGTYAVPTGKNLTITGAVDGVKFGPIEKPNMGMKNYTFNNVTFNYAADSHYKGLQHAGDMVYNNCTFNGQVFLYGNKETFNNCTFNQEDSNNYNVWTYGAKEVAFNDCTFNSAGKSVLVYNEGACATDLTVTDTKFFASATVDDKAAIEIDCSSMPKGTSIVIDGVEEGKTTATGFGTNTKSGSSLWNDKKVVEGAPNGGTSSEVIIDDEVVKEPALMDLAGEGTEENPYLIRNLEDLIWFRYQVNEGNNYAGKYIKVTATEIDLNNEEWTPIAYMGKTFKGNFDGNNVTVKNLKITKALTNSAENNGIGFFGRTDSPATIENIIIENVDITGSLYVGAIVGFGYTGKHVKGCTVKGNIAIDAWWYAGVIGGNGYMNLVDDCHVIGNNGSYIKGNDGSYIGGIWGFRGEGNNKITNCTVTNLNIIGVDRVGGICGIGHYGNTISGCDAEDVTVTATDPDATTIGLLVGATQGNDISGQGPTIFEDNDASGITAQIDNGDGTYTEVTNLYGTNIDGIVAVTNYVAQIVGGTQYATLAEAVAAAVNNDVITLLPTNAPIAMNASLYGKDVTITGTATVDWSKGWFFVGRGGEGNATVTFDGANLTSASTNENSGLGIHVSGREKNTDNKYDGTLVIKNSTIELDYLIDRGAITIDNATLTVTNGFGIAGRPGTETESGEDATATITLNNESKVVVNNHNGMGLGIAATQLEGFGIMNINSGSTFETTQSFTVTAKGTMNVNGGNVKVVGTLTNNGAVNVTGNASMNVNTLTGNAINFTNVTIANANIGGAVNAFSTNNFTGETNIEGTLSVGYNGSPAEQVVVNITGNFNGGNVLIGSSNEHVLNVGNAEGEKSTAYFGQIGAFGDVNIVNADVTYGYTFIRNDFNVTNSTMKIKGGVNTYFAGNATVVLDNTTWNLPGYANIGSYGGSMYGNADVTLKNGSVMNGTNLGIEVSGENVVKVTLEGNSRLEATKLTNQGSIVLADVEAKVTSNKLTGTNNVPTTTVADHKVVYENGAYVVTAKHYVAQVKGTDNNVRVKFETFAEALDAVENGETIELLGTEGSEINKEIEFTKDIEFTITGTAPNYALPVVTFQNATVNISNAEILIPELDARKDATINVINSTVYDAGGNSIAKSYYNGALNISGNSKVYMMQVTTMGYINISDNAQLHATWQTNVYGNGLVTIEDNATFNTAALHLTGQAYSGRDNTDAGRVGKPAEIVVDGANLTIGKVLSSNNADYSYNSSKGINVGTVEGKSAILNIKNGGNVNIYMANGEKTNFGAGATVNVDASTLKTICRSAEGTVTLANAGTVYVTGAANLDATVTGNGWFYMNGVTLDADTKLLGAKVGFINGENNIVASTIKDGWFSVGIGKNTDAETAAAFATANGITLGDVTVNVSDNATVYTSTDAAYSGWVGSAYSANKGVNKYILNINNSLARFGYMHVSKDGEMNVTGQTNNKYEYAGNAVDFYAGTFINNGNVTLNGVDAWAQYTKISVDHADAVLNITNGTKYEANCTTGNVNANTFLYHKAGTVNVDATSSVNIEKATTLVDGAVLNIASDNVIAKGAVTGNGTINLTDLDAKFTAQEGLTVNNGVEGNTDYGVTYVNGAYQFAQYVAQIGDEKYLTLQEAVNAATNDATIVLIKSIEQADGVIIDSKNIVVDLNEETFTVTEGANTNNRNFKIIGTSVVTIKNGTMVAAGDYSSGAYGTVRTEGTAEVTLTGLKLYNYRGNGLNIKALGGTTVAIDNTEIYSQYGGGIEAAGGIITLAETVKVEQKGMYTAPYNSMAISVNSGGSVTVNGGTYSTECITAEEANGQGSSHGPWVVGVLNSGGTLIINGGTFSNDNFGDNSLATYARGAVLADTGAEIEIKGGTFNALKAIIDMTNNLGDANNNPSALLSGGTFSADPRISGMYASHLIVVAQGYIVVDNEDGTYSVVEDQVAKIGDVTYKLLHEAFDAAQDGDEIVVLKDIVLTEGITVAADDNMTLDLNGKTISMQDASNNSAYAIKNNGNLTIKDSAEGGKITFNSTTPDSSFGYATSTIGNGGHLTIENGLIENTTEGGASYAVDGIWHTGEASLTINDGTITATKIAVRQVPFSATAKNTVTINGGTLTGETAGLQMFNISDDAKLSETIIKGGTFNGTYAFYTSFRSAQASGLATINIDGGTFNGYVYLYNGNNGSNEYPMTVAITDGLFNSGAYIYTKDANGNEVPIKAISGGIFSVDPTDYCAESYGAVELPDGTWFVRMLAGTQTREFANAGWYWFSTYIQNMEGQNGLTTLKSELDGKGKEIKSQHGGIRYYPAYDSWTNALTSLSTSEMYMINTTDPVTVEFNGDFVEYESRTINLVEGWNWIGYPVSQELDINVALKNLQAKEGDYIKGKNDDEDAWFVEGYGWWSETEDFKFKPGHGYMYLSQQATSFTFNAVGGEDVNTDVRRSVANNYHWNADATQYPSNMTMVAVVDGIDDNEYEVAAFVNGEVRGSARPAYFEPLDTYILVLTIHGDDVEEMTFKYYDLSTNTEYNLNNKINYSNDAIVGSIYEPYMLTRGTTGIGEAAMSQVNIYPNPTTTGTEINLEATCDKVEVFNALGVKVVEYQNVDSIDALETAGIYVIRITNNGNVQNCRLVVK